MPQFVYRAINERGRSIRGTLAAANEVDLYQALQETGLELVDARQQGRRRSFLTFLARVTPRELIQLCLHMTELSRAGVPLLEGLNDIRDTTESPVLRDALSEVVRDVSEGATLSHAFAKHPKVFDHIFVSLIATGEQTGNLTESFKHLSHHLKWAASMRSKITKASRYPLFTLVVAMGVMFFLMVFVVPQVIELLKATGTELPMATVALIVFSDFMVYYWWAIIATMVGSWLLVKTLARLSEDFAFWLDGLYLRIPVLGPTMKKIALSRFAHFFAVTYQSGIEILRCLDSARNVLGHRTLAESILTAEQAVRNGTPLSVALNNTGDFPSLVVRMIRVGEDTGNLSETLEQITEFYDREVDDSIEAMIGSIQPSLTFLIGGLVGWVVVAVLGPIYDNLANFAG